MKKFFADIRAGPFVFIVALALIGLLCFWTLPTIAKMSGGHTTEIVQPLLPGSESTIPVNLTETMVDTVTSHILTQQALGNGILAAYFNQWTTFTDAQFVAVVTDTKDTNIYCDTYATANSGGSKLPLTEIRATNQDARTGTLAHLARTPEVVLILEV